MRIPCVGCGSFIDAENLSKATCPMCRALNRKVSKETIQMPDPVKYEPPHLRALNETVFFWNPDLSTPTIPVMSSGTILDRMIHDGPTAQLAWPGTEPVVYRVKWLPVVSCAGDTSPPTVYELRPHQVFSSVSALLDAVAHQ